MAKNHLGACPSLLSGFSQDCSCEKEVAHYLKLAMWSFGLFAFEFFGGRISDSGALVSDSYHVLADGAENIISVIVSYLSMRGSNEQKLRDIGGKISGYLLLTIGCWIVYEGWGHIHTPHKVEWYMGFFAIVGLIVVEKQLKHHHEAPTEHRNVTHFWQRMHLLSDKWAIRMVIVGWLIMLVTNGYYWIDGVLQLSIGLLVVAFTTAKILGVEVHSCSHGKTNAHPPHKHGDKCTHHH